jgi:hypothetical protein
VSIFPSLVLPRCVLLLELIRDIDSNRSICYHSLTQIFQRGENGLTNRSNSIFRISYFYTLIALIATWFINSSKLSSSAILFADIALIILGILFFTLELKKEGRFSSFISNMMVIYLIFVGIFVYSLILNI